MGLLDEVQQRTFRVVRAAGAPPSGRPCMAGSPRGLGDFQGGSNAVEIPLDAIEWDQEARGEEPR